MQEVKEGKVITAGSFPYRLEDLISWTVRRTDGTTARFILTEAAKELVGNTQQVSTAIKTDPWSAKGRETGSLSAWCQHTPKTPIWENDSLRLYVGDNYGAKATKDDFDFVIDGGDVLNYFKGSTILAGDQTLVEGLKEFAVEMPATRLLKIDWWDRKAPEVVPEFWVALNKLVTGDVMTCCQGGHGRSGTSAVCLMLVNSPDYDALDAIVHLRAVHCPRAIESKVQHEYINDVAKFLGREANGDLAGEIKDYKGAFRASKKPTAIRMRKILGWDK